MYVNVQTLLPSKFTQRTCILTMYAWFALGFPFLCVKEIAHRKVSNVVYCRTCIWRLKYISCVNIALFVWLLMTLQGGRLYLGAEFKRRVK
jgi:hypothetical protein